ncbi:MAG: daunorubicin/doxorubicin transport system ATP-binding protein [Thermoleophilaceae bacterium]|nr:daunorubicin/doxorubicin transport system ATP-binding protein [Thermoleophilaceae bacterium]
MIADGLTKVYPNGLRAADGISLCASGGEAVGVVGPNGAGKSTTLNMLATLLKPTSGTGSVWGVPLEDVDRVRPKIGVALQGAGLDPLMTGAEHFEVQAALYRLPREWRAQAAALVERFELGAYAGRLVGQYSGGIQRRLALALALLPNPPVIIFDEPSVGLDPRSRRNLWELVRSLRNEGRAVLLSTQYLEEADALCDRVYLIDHGRIVLAGAPADLKRGIGGAALRVEVEGRPDELLAAIGNGASVDGDTIVYALDGDVSVAGRVLVAARERGIALRSLRVSEPTLDDVFLQYTGRAMEPEPLSGDGFDLGARMQRGGGKKWRQ